MKVNYIVRWVSLSFFIIASLCVGGLVARIRNFTVKPQTSLCPVPGTFTGTARTEEEWKKILTPDQYRVLREKGTEQAFTGVYVDQHEKGVYRCAACGEILFRSEDKFDSGTGWPSFLRPARGNNIGYRVDTSHGKPRTEVYCRKCGGHLGHVFNDGPRPTGNRYCINSAALQFKRQ